MKATKDKQSETPRRRGGLMLVKWIAISAVVVVVVAVVGIPAYFSSDSGRRFVLSRINDSIDGEVNATDLSMGWFKGISMTDVTFSDAEGNTSFSVKKISAKPRLGALLGGSLAFKSAVVDSPNVVINVEQPSGTERLEGQPQSKPQPAVSSLPLAMLDMEIRQGNATVNLSEKERLVQTVTFKNIESKVNLNQSGKDSSFDVDMAVADADRESHISASGNMKQAKKRWTLKGTSGDFKLTVDRLDLVSLRPLFALAGKDIRTEGHLDANADIRMSKGRFERIVTRAELRDFKRANGEIKTVLEEPVVIDADISSVDDVLSIDHLMVESSFCKVRCSGQGSQVDYDATADLKGVKDFGSQFMDFGEYDMTGDVSAKGRIAIDDEGVRVTGDGLAERLVVKKGDLATPVTTANVGFDIQTDRKSETARVSLARVLADPGRIELSNSVIPLGAETGEVELMVASDLDLQKFQPYLALATDIPKGMHLGGQLASEVSVTGRDKKYHLVTDKTNIKNLVIAPAEGEPFKQEAVKIVADINVDTENKELTINDLSLTSKQGESLIELYKGQIKETTRGEKTKVTGEIDAGYDWATVSAVAAGVLPEGLTMEGKRRTRLQFDSEYPTGTDLFLANLNAKTSIGFDKAHYQGLNFSRADMDVVVNNGLLTLDLPPTTVNEGKVRFAGNINFKENPPTLRMARPAQLVENVKINDIMTDRMMKYVNPLFAQQTNIGGIANFQCEKMSIPLGGAASNKDIEVIGTVDVKNVSLKPAGLMGQLMPMGGRGELLPTRIVVQNGWVSYDDMPIVVEKYPLNFKGRIGLDETVDMTVVLPLTLALKTAKVGESDARVPIPLSGTLKNIKLDFSRVPEEAGKEFIKEQIPKELEKIFRRL